MILSALIAAVLLQDGNVTIEGRREIDPARSTILKVVPRGLDLRDRFRGFTLAEDYDDEKENFTSWRLVPEPCAKEYKIAPVAFEGRVIGPVYFDPPTAREPVTGAMEVEVSRDFPPLSWKLVGWIALALVGLAALVAGAVLLVKYLVRRVKEHRMSPIERAWAELDRLMKKGLPGRGRYKDFYVELTMVVRRYVQRRYGIRAPHLTTEEFLANFGNERPETREELRRFLESADMVKFAGVEATPEMADDATESARSYLKGDAAKDSAAGGAQ